jgi:hypothetical protein
MTLDTSWVASLAGESLEDARELAAWLNRSDASEAKVQREVREAIRMLGAETLSARERLWLLRLFARVHQSWILTYRGKGEQLKANKLVALGGQDDASEPTRMIGGPAVAAGDVGIMLLSGSRHLVADRLGRCRQCGRFFIALKPSKAYCSENCRLQFWADFKKTDAGRKKQAEQMRQWRAHRAAQAQ